MFLCNIIVVPSSLSSSSSSLTLTVPSTLCTWSHLILTLGICGPCCYYPHFVDEGTDREKLRNLPRFTQLRVVGPLAIACLIDLQDLLRVIFSFFCIFPAAPPSSHQHTHTPSHTTPHCIAHGRFLIHFKHLNS